MSMSNFITIFLLFLYSTTVLSDEHDHKYTHGEDIVVWANSVGPKVNNQETYSLYTLPYCKGEAKISHYHETLGEALLGYRLEHSGILINFKEGFKNSKDICSQFLSVEQIQKFKYAINKNYEYTIVVDGIQERVEVGHLSNSDFASDKGKYQLYTHLKFHFLYNNNQIVGFDLISSNLVILDSPVSVKFTYEVSWEENTKLSFENRRSIYSSKSTDISKEQKSRWLAIGNSFLLVMLLVGVVSIILIRTLRKDFTRYGFGIDGEESDFEALERDLLDDFGWKQVHGDVFRPPLNLMYLSSALGVGTQICGVVLAVLLFTIVGDWSYSRSKILTAGIFIYSILAILGGYSSTRFYTSYGGKFWVHNSFFTSMSWPFCVAIISSIVNTIAIFWSSSRAISFLTILSIFSIWLFLTVPLTLIGAFLGRKAAAGVSFPCRVNALPRPVPVKLWYQEPYIMILFSGAISFGSLFIELYYILRAFWTLDEPYFMYGFFLFSFFLLLILTSCLAIVNTYLFLNSEDHRWHWFAFFSGASTSIYVYLYAIYYFWFKTQMYGAFQSFFYFGYLLLTCFALSVVLGTVSTWATALFVIKIYSTVKID